MKSLKVILGTHGTDEFRKQVCSSQDMTDTEKREIINAIDYFLELLGVENCDNQTTEKEAKMKYKQGDKVIIKPFYVMAQQYGQDDKGNINLKGGWDIGKECDFKHTNRVLKIVNVLPGAYLTEYSDGRTCQWMITDDMILGRAYEVGEEIEVILVDKATVKGSFIAYSDDGSIYIRTEGGVCRNGSPKERNVFTKQQIADALDLNIDEFTIIEGQ